MAQGGQPLTEDLNMTEYQVYLKSHCEAPDFEGYYTETELKAGRCLIPCADDYDKETGQAMGGPCGGKLIANKGGYRCTACDAQYVRGVIL